MSEKMWFQPCTDEKHPRGPHLHPLDGVTIEVRDDRIVNEAKRLAVPETDVRQEMAARYVEVKCPTCGWLHLIAPRERNHPCEAVASCAGTVSDPEDRTFECVPQGFKARVAALLKKWQYGTEDMCPACGADVMPSFPQWKHRDDCALAALLREAEA